MYSLTFLFMPNLNVLSVKRWWFNPDLAVSFYGTNSSLMSYLGLTKNQLAASRVCSGKTRSTKGWFIVPESPFVAEETTYEIPKTRLAWEPKINYLTGELIKDSGRSIELYKEGDKFGNWTFIKELAKKGTRRTALFRCTCGVEKAVNIQKVKTGGTKGCGLKSCLFYTYSSFKHGESSYTGSTKEYRCLNPNDKAYPDYGGREIRISEHWLDDFSHFLEDMGRAPSTEHSIERIDNEKGYYKENCRWATIA